MKKEPYNPFKDKNIDIYWTSGMILFMLGWMIQFFTRVPHIIREPYWSSILKDGLVCFWSLLILRRQIKILLKHKTVWYFIPWLFGTAFSIGVMLIFSFFSSRALVEPAMIALTDTKTIEVKAQMKSKEILSHHGNNYYVDLELNEELEGVRSFRVTEKLYNQLDEGDWAIVSFQKSDNRLLYYTSHNIRLAQP